MLFADKNVYPQVLIEPRGMKLCTIANKPQVLNSDENGFPPNTSDKETPPLSIDNVIDTIYQGMPTKWNSKRIIQ